MESHFRKKKKNYKKNQTKRPGRETWNLFLLFWTVRIFEEKLKFEGDGLDPKGPPGYVPASSGLGPMVVFSFWRRIWNAVLVMFKAKFSEKTEKLSFTLSKLVTDGVVLDYANFFFFGSEWNFLSARGQHIIVSFGEYPCRGWVRTSGGVYTLGT